MKTLKYVLILILVLGAFYSCVDKETRYDLNSTTKNLAGFEINQTMVSGISDGTEYTFPMKVKVVGPTVKDLKSDITLTIAVDQALIDETVADDTTLTSAIEGVHYRIDNPVVVLRASNNYLGVLNISMITDGIVTPLEKTPILILKTSTATGDSKVTNNGKPLKISLNFACFSEFQGTYTVTINRVSATGVATTYVRTDEVITKIGVETYRTTYVGHWTPGQMAPGRPGFTFTNACNKLAVAEQLLADYWANVVTGTALGTADPFTVDPVTGDPNPIDLYIEYSVCYPPETCNTYKCTYVKNITK